MEPAPTTWVLTDGSAGNERQACALAQALSPAPPRIWKLDARPPWRWVAPRQIPGSRRAFGPEFEAALREPPMLAIGCGRQAALATRVLRDGGARVVQILDPRIAAHHWDAVVVPEHDALRAPNVVTLLGSLHAVDAASLAAGRARYPQFGMLHAPRTLLLLGGPIANAPLDAGWWRRTAATLRDDHAREGGSLSLCASPRTPRWLVEAARSDLSDLHGAAWLEPRDGPNPYAGLLGWAERIVVTPDSVNMASEAIATSAAVCIASPGLAVGRHAAFLATLLARGRARPLDASDRWQSDATPVIETPRVAAAIRQLLHLDAPTGDDR